MAFSIQTKPLTTPQILHVALKLSTKNPTLILPILLLSFLTTSFLLFYFFSLFSLLTADPPLTHIVARSYSRAVLDPNTPKFASLLYFIAKDFSKLISIDSILVIFSFIIPSIFVAMAIIYSLSIATIHAFSLSYSSKTPTAEDFIYEVSSILEGPIITCIYTSLLRLAYTILLLLSIINFIVVARGTSMISLFLGTALCFSGLVLKVYLSMLWSVSMVISVVERGCYGVEAIAKAGKIMRGRGRQGAKLIIFVSVMFGGLFWVCKLARSYVSDPFAKLSIGLACVAAAIAMNMYAWAVSVAFYYDCKESFSTEDGRNDTDEFKYAGVSASQF